MGHVNAQIILKNCDDVKRAKKEELPECEVRQAAVNALVDTGASTLIINQKLFEELGLDVLKERVVTFANDAKEICKVTEPVEIHWKDRLVVLSALVVESATQVLLGVLPLEGMDLIVDPINHELVGVHGDQIVYRA